MLENAVFCKLGIGRHAHTVPQKVMAGILKLIIGLSGAVSTWVLILRCKSIPVGKRALKMCAADAVTGLGFRHVQ